MTRVLKPLYTPMRKIKPEVQARFTQIDYDREIALIAIRNDGGEKRILGVARIIGDADAKSREFAVLVLPENKNMVVLGKKLGIDSAQSANIILTTVTDTLMILDFALIFRRFLM